MGSRNETTQEQTGGAGIGFGVAFGNKQYMGGSSNAIQLPPMPPPHGMPPYHLNGTMPSLVHDRTL